MTIAKELRNRRVAAGLTQTQFAEKIGVKQATVSLYELGKTVPGVEKLPIIADVLGCTTDALLRGKATDGAAVEA